MSERAPGPHVIETVFYLHVNPDRPWLCIIQGRTYMGVEVVSMFHA